jgi:aminopeptidase C
VASFMNLNGTSSSLLKQNSSAGVLVCGPSWFEEYFFLVSVDTNLLVHKFLCLQ